MANENIITQDVFEQSIKDILTLLVNNTYNFTEYTDEEIGNLIDLDPTQIAELTAVISDSVVAKNKVFSSSHTTELIQKSVIESNEYADSLVANLSNIKLDIVDTLPDASTVNKSTIYILKDSTGGTNNTLNVWSDRTSAFVEVGKLSVDFTNYYTKSEVDALLDDKADDNNVVHQEDIVSNLTATSGTTTLSTAGLQTELDKKANDDEFDTHKNDTDIHITSAERTAWNNKQYKVFNYGDITSKNTINTLADLIKLVPSGETWYIHALSVPNSVSIADFGFPSGMNRWGAIVISKRANNQTQYYIELSTTADYLVTHKWTGCGSGVDYTNGSVTIPAYTTQWQEIAIGFTNKIDVNSKDSQTPSAKAAFDATIGAMPTTEMVENANNSVLQFPLGNWLIYSTAFAKTLDDLPIQEGGRLQVLGNYVSADTPWTARYWVRMYRYSSYAKGEWIRYLNSGDTAGVIASDSGWLKVCTTKVADVSNTDITFSDETKYSIVNNNCKYFVKNGTCTVQLYVTCNASVGAWATVSSGLPKPSGFPSYGALSNPTGDKFVNYVINTSGVLQLKNGVNGINYIGTFSYPVAES